MIKIKRNFTVEIKGARNIRTLQFENVEVTNGEGLLATLIKTPAGTVIDTETERVVKILDIVPGIEYKNLSIEIDDCDVIELDDIFIEPNKKNDNYHSDEDEESEEEVLGKKISEAKIIEHELTDKWLEELRDLDKQTLQVEEDLTIVEDSFSPYIEAVNKAQKLVDEKISKIKEVENALNEARELHDAALEQSANQNLFEKQIKEFLKVAAEKEKEIEANENKLPRLSQELGELKTALAKTHKELTLVNQEAAPVLKRLVIALQAEFKIKDLVLTNLNKKGNKANHLTREAWKLEDIAKTKRTEWNDSTKELENLNRAMRRAEGFQIEAEEHLSLATPVTRSTLEKELAHAKHDFAHAAKKVAHAEKKVNRLKDEFLKARAIAKGRKEEALIATEVAFVAERAAREIEHLIIDEIEKIVKHRALPESQKEKLVAELDFLQTKLDQEIILDEEVDRPEYIIKGEMETSEKIVRSILSKTYWKIYERGYRSRDVNFDEFTQNVNNERERLLFDLKEKQAETERVLKETKEKAEEEVWQIKEKAAAKAEAATLKADTLVSKTEEKAEKIIREAKEAAEKFVEEARINAEKKENEARLRAREARELAEAEAADAKAKAEDFARLAEARATQREKEAKERVEEAIFRAEEEARAVKERAEREAQEARNQAEWETKQARDRAEKEAKEARDKAEKESLAAKKAANYKAMSAQEQAEYEKKEAKEAAERVQREAQERAEKEIREAQERSESEIREAQEKSERAIREAKDWAEAEIAQIYADTEKQREEAEAAVKEAREEADKKVQSKQDYLDRKLEEAELLIEQTNKERDEMVRMIQSQSDGLVERTKAKSDERIEEIQKESDERIAEIQKQADEKVAEVTSSTEGRIAAIQERSDRDVALSQQREHDEREAKREKEHQVELLSETVDQLMAKVSKLEIQLEKTEKQKDIAEKKAKLFAQIEAITNEEG